MLIATHRRDEHFAVFDKHSPQIFLTGFLAGVAGVNTTALAIGFLVFEAMDAEGVFDFADKKSETVANRFGDLASGLTGALLGAWVRSNHPSNVVAIAQRMR